MTADGGGYDFHICDGCVSVQKTTSQNGCTPLGLQMMIPRSKAHWYAAADYVSLTGRAMSSVFQVVPGISKPCDGRTDCDGGRGVLSSDACAASAAASECTWQATDRGRWWLRDTSYNQPSGDYARDCYLAMYDEARNWVTPWTADAKEPVWFNDYECNAFTGDMYMCSTNIEPTPPSNCNDIKKQNADAVS
uniref:C-type lectin domain-containing protein n=1 Tax=Mantoniella antarctica TaxID=81844 RepID=A0A7S0SNI9_9CHLO